MDEDEKNNEGASVKILSESNHHSEAIEMVVGVDKPKTRSYCDVVNGYANVDYFFD